jgi:cytochrome c553
MVAQCERVISHIEESVPGTSIALYFRVSFGSVVFYLEGNDEEWTTEDFLGFLGAIVGAFLFLGSSGVHANVQDDPGALFKTKCAACHGATAEKKFDATKDPVVLLDERLPSSPGFLRMRLS